MYMHDNKVQRIYKIRLLDKNTLYGYGHLIFIEGKYIRVDDDYFYNDENKKGIIKPILY